MTYPGMQDTALFRGRLDIRHRRLEEPVLVQATVESLESSVSDALSHGRTSLGLFTSAETLLRDRRCAV